MSKFYKACHYIHVVITMPVSILFLLHSTKINASYRMSFLRKFKLGFRMFLNSIRIPTGTSFKLHLAMALKILEIPPEVLGDVIECGTWKGGSAANLSLVCRIVGRRLKIYDSFEGLPEGKVGDREAKGYEKGAYAGSLEEVRRNIAKYGAPECCEFIKGWFADTLPSLNRPVVLAFLDVDLEESLATCVKHIWPNLVDCGFLFTDEAVGTDYVALFYSERWWKTMFDRTPPGLIGAGSGLSLGTYYVGPYSELSCHPLQHQGSGAYTNKLMSGYWSYYPEET